MPPLEISEDRVMQPVDPVVRHQTHALRKAHDERRIHSDAHLSLLSHEHLTFHGRKGFHADEYDGRRIHRQRRAGILL